MFELIKPVYNKFYIGMQRAELEEQFDSKLITIFDSIDADQDKILSENEILAFKQSEAENFNKKTKRAKKDTKAAFILSGIGAVSTGISLLAKASLMGGPFFLVGGLVAGAGFWTYSKYCEKQAKQLESETQKYLEQKISDENATKSSVIGIQDIKEAQKDSLDKEI